MARLKVLEAANTEELLENSISLVGSDYPEKRTCDYVLNQSGKHYNSFEEEEGGNAHKDRGWDDVHPTTNYIHLNSDPIAPDRTDAMQRISSSGVNAQITQPLVNKQVWGPSQSLPLRSVKEKASAGLNVSANPYYPSAFNSHYPSDLQAPPVTKTERLEMSEFAKYMIRRELTNTSLTKFDDLPENYRSWKSTFKAAVEDLGISAREELDLLVKWLGAESAERVKRLRAVHVDNPVAGLKMVWERLDQSYGSPEVIENALLKKIQKFPKVTVRDNRKLQELSDLLLELEAAKADPCLSGLSYLDTAQGVNPIVAKLPHALQDKWATQGSRYKQENNVSFPPFSFFSKFIQDIAKTKNDPSFSLTELNQWAVTSPEHEKETSRFKNSKKSVFVQKTDVAPSSQGMQSEKLKNLIQECPLHKKPHPLKKCRSFREKPLQERIELLKNYGLCFRCCASTDHLSRNCKANIRCSECNSDRHVFALHPESSSSLPLESIAPAEKHGGEKAEETTNKTSVASKCTEICGEGLSGRSCSKICLVKVYPKGEPDKSVRMYAILDDQSNRSLARTEFFNIFNVNGNPSSYTLGTCAGQFETKGRRASDFIIASITDGIQLPLPTLIECNQIPDNRDEIPTPEIAHYHPHMKHIASCIPALDKNAQILLLLGRDILRIHKVRQQCNGPHNSPYAQRLDLGWVIVGDACIGKIYRTDIANSLKTNVLINGRPSYFEPCPNHYHVKERPGIYEHSYYASQDDIVTPLPDNDNIGSTVFHTTEHDNKLAPSIEDKEFLKLMNKEFYKDDSNSWVAPLPFRNPRQRLPNNRVQALSRLSSLQRTLEKDPKIKEHFVSFMQKIFENKHAEPAPPLKEGEECWYLPSFGVYHPRKPGQIRVVFDSSAQYEGMSLNSVLLTGPNLTNSLLGVLIRFRKELVAFMADIQQMFYCFIVREDNRNYLRFLWHRNNDTSAEIIDYRMRVHVFGNSPSPAVAIYGLRRTAQEGEKEYGTDARQYVERDFYVDDGIKSVPTDEEAIDLLKRTQMMLSVANLRLHKIVSNSSKVLKAFPPADHATDLKDLDLGKDTPPVQRSLGLHWNISTDEFVFKVSTDEKPYTRRGVLSIINSLYDPLGFVAPVTIQGKSLLRQLSSESKSWDTLLPIEKHQMLGKWTDSLKALEKLCILRCYASTSLSTTTETEIYIFPDASTEAIAVVAYLKVTDIERKPHEGFISNRVERIRRSTKPEQWYYVPTDQNTADLATKSLTSAQCMKLTWMTGPAFLSNSTDTTSASTTFELVYPESDKENHLQTITLLTSVPDLGLQMLYFFYFTWTVIILIDTG